LATKLISSAFVNGFFFAIFQNKTNEIIAIMRVGSKWQYNFYFGAAARLTLFFAANFLFFLLLQVHLHCYKKKFYKITVFLICIDVAKIEVHFTRTTTNSIHTFPKNSDISLKTLMMICC